MGKQDFNYTLGHSVLPYAKTHATCQTKMNEIMTRVCFDNTLFTE